MKAPALASDRVQAKLEGLQILKTIVVSKRSFNVSADADTVFVKIDAEVRIILVNPLEITGDAALRSFLAQTLGHLHDLSVSLKKEDGYYRR